MKSEIRTEKTLNLTLTADAALWLYYASQNDHSEGESELERKIREGFFNAVKNFLDEVYR